MNTNRKQAALDALERLDAFEKERSAHGGYVPTAEERRLLFGYVSSTPQTLRSIRAELEAIAKEEVPPNYTTDPLRRMAGGNIDPIMRKEG